MRGGFGATSSAIQDIENAFNSNQQALFDARNALIALGLQRRAGGSTLTDSEIESFNETRRKSAQNVTFAIAKINADLEAIDQSTSWIPIFGGGYKDKYGIKDDLGLKLLDAIPLLPREILPPSYQVLPGYPDLTPDEANFGWVPAAWAVGTALVLIAAAAFMYVSADSIRAIFVPKAVEMESQSRLIKQAADSQAELFRDMVSKGVDPTKAADAASKLGPKIPDTGDSDWAWTLLKWGGLLAALGGGAYYLFGTSGGKRLVGSLRSKAEGAASRHLKLVKE